ncbi:MAG: restriction endonuclease subunit S [Ruminococcus sp.]|nr:restriction endonuclease subunit S [Ruminococcus sp.]
MREMKDSGIEWVGNIPATWKSIQIKNLFTILSGATPTPDTDNWDGDVLWITPADYKTKDKYVSGGKRNISQQGFNTCSTSMIPKGSIIFSKRAPIGTVAINTEVLCTNQGCLSCVSKSDTCNDYYYYVMSVGTEHFELLGSGTTFKEISANSFSNCKLPCPDKCEQEKIAFFLDERCSAFNCLISDIQSQIETLEEYKRSVITEAVTKGLDPDVEMKDSGVDYIGKMNAKWKLTKLRYICEKLNRYFTSDAEPLICSNKGEVFPRGENSFGLVSDNDKMFQGVHKGDLLIHGMDTWHGAIAVSDYDGKCTTVVHVCDSEQNKYFICYFLQMLAFKSVYKAISNGVRENTSDFRSWDKAGHIYITIPDIDEQNRIAEYIKEMVEHINAIIAEKKQQIETIEEYKKSLIFEYVTGKKEVQA